MALGHGDLQAKPAIVLPGMNEWGGGAALWAQERADIVSAGSVEHLLIQWRSAKHFVRNGWATHKLRSLSL